MEINGLLPIGSVVLLENSKKKVMVVGLAQRSAQNPDRIYDYVGVVFPEGFLDASKMILFNNKIRVPKVSVYDPANLYTVCSLTTEYSS